MKINNRLFLIFMSGLTLSSFAAWIVFHEIVVDKLLYIQSSKLTSLSQRKVDLLTARLKKSEMKLKSFSHILESELNKSIKEDEIVLFNQIMEKNSDGVWLNRKSKFNGEFEAGMFIPESSNSTNLQKIQNLRIKRAMDVFGSSGDNSENIWFLSSARSEIMFDKGNPDYIFNELPNADYTQTPWLLIGSSKLETNKEVLITPPLFDPANKVWMVSAVYPIYVNHTWIGNIGEDTHIKRDIESLLNVDEVTHKQTHFLIDGEGKFLIDGEGKFILGGEIQSEDFYHDEKFNLDSEPELIELLKIPLTNQITILSNDFSFHEQKYFVIGASLPFNWRYYSIISLDELMETVNHILLWMFGIIIIFNVLNIVFCSEFINGLISKRITNLLDSMLKYTKDKSIVVSEEMALYSNYKDEINDIAEHFDFVTSKLSFRDNKQLVDFLDRELEQQKHINELQKLDSIDRLTSGVAHDFNNILGVIYSSSEMILLAAEDIRNQDNLKTEIESYVANIMKSSQRAKGIIDNMLLYCRRHSDIHISNPIHNFNKSVQLNLEIFSQTAKTIMFETDFFHTTENVCLLNLNETDLDQILINLLTNARDALIDNHGFSRGLIKIQTDLLKDIPSFICDCCAEKIIGDYFIKLTIKDNGCGMDPAISSRIFDPFFTTKPVGQGIGLGLSVVSGIVHKANGHIRIKSEKGKGTEFRILFPVDKSSCQ